MTWAEWLRANAALLPHLVAGMALLLGGLWLLGRSGNPRATRFFAAFLAGYGAAIVLTAGAVREPGLNAGLFAAGGVAYFFASSAMLVSILAFPQALLRAVESRWAMLFPAAVAGTFAGFLLLTNGRYHSGSLAFSIGNMIPAITTGVLIARFAREPPGSARRSLFLLTVGLGLQGAFFWTGNIARLALGESPYQDSAVLGFVGNGFSLAVLLAGAVLLLRVAFGSERELAGMARFALAVIALGAATALVAAAVGDSAWVTAMGGVTRLVFAGLVTWGVLRHQFLGVDVRVRWAIGRSTIAGAFIAAFFVASEGAQIVFGQGNEWVGLFAAAALVFAIAPLQRAAERLAEKAVPVVDPSPSRGRHPNADAYALAVRTALAAGRLTPDVDRHLADLADKLGIRAGEAFRLRQAVVQEAAEQ